MPEQKEPIAKKPKAGSKIIYIILAVVLLGGGVGLGIDLILDFMENQMKQAIKH